LRSRILDHIRKEYSHTPLGRFASVGVLP
jgi:hypothetical protein